MSSESWLRDASEGSLRAALRAGVPRLAELPIRINEHLPSSNPLWWSATAFIDERFVVKYAWSEIRAARLWREGILMERLRALEPAMPLPEVVAVASTPVLVVTRRVRGDPLSWEWASGLAPSHLDEVADQLAGFLVRLHRHTDADLLADLIAVTPTPQADTGLVRRGFLRMVDERRQALVLRWCEWVDDVLDGDAPGVGGGLVHGDLHGYNQIWDRTTSTLKAVVDFEETGIADPNFDFRYLPGNAQSLDLVRAVMQAYERVSGRRLDIERVMAWHVLTVLGDALWRTEAGVELPGGGTPTSWVDELASRLDALRLG